MLDTKGDVTVKMAARWVSKYQHAPLWDRLGEAEYKELHDHIAPLVTPDDDDDSAAQRFDALMVNLQLAKALARADEPSYHQKLETIAGRLLEKQNIPEIAQRRPLLQRMQDPDFYRDQRQRQLDEIRREIRGLIQYHDTADQAPVYTNFEDTISTSLREPGALPRMSAEVYRRRVAEYLRQNTDQLVIRKLMSNTPITRHELASLEALLFDGAERGTLADFEASVGEEPVVGHPLLSFVRSIVGLDPLAVDAVFAGFIAEQGLTAAQIRFIDQIKQHLQRAGLLEPRALFRDPYTALDAKGVAGVFGQAQVRVLVGKVRGVNAGVEVA